MKHILNNLSEEEKNAIREQHTGGMKVMTENFNKLINSKLGDSKPIVEEKEIISEQDNTPIEIRRRIPEISQKFDEMLDSLDNNPNDFSDEFEYADNMISLTVDKLVFNTNDSYYEDNEDDVRDFIKDTYGDFLFDRWYSEVNDDEEDVDN